MAADAAPIVELRNVVRVYRRGEAEVRALAGVSLALGAGEFTAVAGPSGSGKSTLLHLMGLLDRPDQGQVFLAGRDTAALSSRERARARNARIGFVFQSFHLLPRASALDNVTLPLLYSGLDRHEARARALQALDRVGLAGRRDHRPGELSGGECQRVAIARATVMQPGLILADEPTGNLDRRTGADILDLFAGLNAERGAAVVIVTHDPEVAGRCRRRIRLEDGRVTGDEP